MSRIDALIELGLGVCIMVTGYICLVLFFCL
jgi:hypothetical protein